MLQSTRFNTIKQLFLTAAKETLSTRDDVIPQMLMGIARDLTPGEVLVLSAAYEIAEHPEGVKKSVSADNWLRKIAETSPLNLMSMIELYERRLIEKKLLTDRTLNDRSGVVLGNHFRLTDLGVKLCQFLKWSDDL